jgi:DNA-binding PadR family transcriptional regulator
MNHHHRRHHTRRRYRHSRTLPERGWIQFLLLRVIHERPMHGYQLIESMESRGYVQSGRFDTGSIYTILNRMAKRGLLSSVKSAEETGRIRRIYSLTEVGEEALKRGLEGVIQRKTITDELTKYYHQKFGDGSIPEKE